MPLQDDLSTDRAHRHELVAIELAQEAALSRGDGVGDIMARLAALHDISLADRHHAQSERDALGLESLPPGEALALAGELIRSACRQLGGRS
jgi:hypothetical protein